MEKLLEILQRVRPDVDFKNETLLIDDGILDSMDVVSINELIPDNFNSVEAIWNLIQNLKNPKENTK